MVRTSEELQHGTIQEKEKAEDNSGTEHALIIVLAQEMKDERDNDPRVEPESDDRFFKWEKSFQKICIYNPEVGETILALIDSKLNLTAIMLSVKIMHLETLDNDLNTKDMLKDMLRDFYQKTIALKQENVPEIDIDLSIKELKNFHAFIDKETVTTSVPTS